MSTPIDFARVRQILERFRSLDIRRAYYAKDEVRMRYVGEVVPSTGDVLRRAFAHADRVLDIGCGDGRRLIESTDRIGHGVGIDESPWMIAAALAAREGRGLANLEFEVAKAVALPFADASFDLVYTERGPLGHCDATLVEALRVLRPGGLLFVETLGDFDALAVERERFLRHGVDLQTLAARRQTLVFEDFYEYLTYRCSVWVYCERELPSPDEPAHFEAMLRTATDEQGRIRETYDTIWIAGRA